MHDRENVAVRQEPNCPQYPRWNRGGQKFSGAKRGQRQKKACSVNFRARGRMEGYDGGRGYNNHSVNNEDTYQNDNQQREGMNRSPLPSRPYSQRQMSPTFKSRQDTQPHIVPGNPAQGSATVSAFDALLNGQVETLIESPEHPGEHGVHDVVQKLSQDKKPSRQVLMLQQQMYQEGQGPIEDQGERGASTQFYSHFNYQQTNYFGYNSQWQHNGYHDNNRYHNRGNGYQYNSAHNTQPYLQGNYNNQQNNNYGRNNNYPSSGHGNNNYYPSSGQSNNNYPSSGHGNNYNNYSSSGYGYNNYNASTKNPYSVRSESPSEGSCDGSSVPGDVVNQFPGSVDLLISNLDYNISPREWKHILMTTFHPHVKILHIDVSLQPDNTSLGMIKVGSLEEARFGISQFHRKKIGYKRIHVTLRADETVKPVSTIRSEAITLLTEAKDHVLPLFRFIELFNKRYNRSVSVSELYKMRDTIEVWEQTGSGRMIHLLPGLQNTTPVPETLPEETEEEEVRAPVVCSYHCPEGSHMYVEAVNMSILPNVKLQLKTFAAQVHSLLMTHDGDIPLMSFPACFSAEVVPLTYVYEGGVPLEHVISCVPGVQIVVSNTGVKKVSWAENKPPGSPDLHRPGTSHILAQQLNQFSRDMVELMKSSLSCRMAFSKFIPSYHHHFGKQCRVSDYGYSKLMELFEAVPHVLQVIGTGERKVLTLTHRAQVKRFTADLLRLLKTVPGKQVYVSALSEEFCKLFNKNWEVSEYGVSYVEDILGELPAGTVEVSADGNETVISVPRKEQSPEELERLRQFCLEVVDLLKHNHQCKMMFTKFIPAYHHHFGRQCRVSDYGFTKLLDLFEAIPHVAEVEEEGDEKMICLTEPELRKVIGEKIVNLIQQNPAELFPLDILMGTFTQLYGFAIPLKDLGVNNIEALLSALQNMLKVCELDGSLYVSVATQTDVPSLAKQVLQLLMNQSGGSLPLMELSSRYKTTFGEELDVKKIRKELLDYVQVSGDEESGVIGLTRLQILARDIRILLQEHKQIPLTQLDKLFYEHFCQEIKPALYGFQSVQALLSALPHVVAIETKGHTKVIMLSEDQQDHGDWPPSPSSDLKMAAQFLPATLPTVHDLDSKSQSSSPTQDILDLLKQGWWRSSQAEDLGFNVETSPEKASSYTGDQKKAPTLPESYNKAVDHFSNKIVSTNEQEAKTGTLDFVPVGPGGQAVPKLAVKQSGAKFEKRRSVDSAEQVNVSIGKKDTCKMNIKKVTILSHAKKADSDYKGAINSLSATLSFLKKEQELTKENKSKGGPQSDETIALTTGSKVEDGSTDATKQGIASMKPLQPGSYWFSKKFQQEKPQDLPSTSPEDVRKVLANLSNKENKRLDRKIVSPDSGVQTKTTYRLYERVRENSLSPGSKAVNLVAEIMKENIETVERHLITSQVAHSLVPVDDKIAEEDEYQQQNDDTDKSSVEKGNKDSLKVKKTSKLVVVKPKKTGTTIEICPEHSELAKPASVDPEVETSQDKPLIQSPKKRAYGKTAVASLDTRADFKTGISQHQLENCVAEDCMCYEAMFRQDHPLETSSLKSDGSDSPDVSPKKKVLLRPSNTSPLSDEAHNSSMIKRRSRMAAKFSQQING